MVRRSYPASAGVKHLTVTLTRPRVSRRGASGKAWSAPIAPSDQTEGRLINDMEHRYAPAGLDIGQAEKVGIILQERVASLIDLSLILKHVHWNVVGSGFIAVHELMDTQSDQTRQMVDEIAERITTLGGVAAGLAGQVVEMRSADEEYALGRAPVMAHLGALDKVYERLGSGHREAIEQVAGIDPVSEDLLISQTAQLEMNHWFIRAQISDTDGRLATEGASSQLDAAAAAGHALQPEAVPEDD